MILIGQYDSPFVRRVGVSLNLLEIPFERRVISVFDDFDETLKVNPLGKVPALELDDGEVLVDSQIILDHIDEIAGPERALTPAGGAARREVLRRTMVATGLGDKFIALRGELFRRREGSQDPAIIERLETQIRSALAWLEAAWTDVSIEAGKPDPAAIATAVILTFVKNKPPEFFKAGRYPVLEALNQKLEPTPAFLAAPFGGDS